MTGRSQTDQHQVDPTLHEKSHGSTQHRESADRVPDDQARSSPTGSSRSSIEPDNHGSSEVVEDGMVPIPLCTSPREVRRLRKAMSRPSINKDSLQQLNLGVVEEHIRLRVDINFDQHVQFRPGAGSTAEERRTEAKEYWEALAAELKILCQHNILAKCPQCEEKLALGDVTQLHFRPRLEKMFFTLKELVIMMTPDEEFEEICHYLDIPLRMQEACHGMLDASRLGQWLCRLLSSHCAPVRDTAAREMARTIEEGVEKGDFSIIVDGIRLLFALLESMKLDVANHQVRNRRYSLIEDTVHFQRKHFRNCIHAGKLLVKPSRWWFVAASERHEPCPPYEVEPRSPPLAALVHGLVAISVNPHFKIPESLFYDTRRSNAIQDEVQDLVHLRICHSLFDELVYSMMGLEPTAAGGSSPVQDCIETKRHELEVRLWDLTDGVPNDDLTMSQIWHGHKNHVVLEVLRAASVVSAEMLKTPPKPLSEAQVAEATARIVKEFDTEAQKMTRLKIVARELEELGQAQTRAFENMTALAISDAQKRWYDKRMEAKDRQLIPSVEDLSRKIAHIAVIHFRVWADMIYLCPAEPMPP